MDKSFDSRVCSTNKRNHDRGIPLPMPKYTPLSLQRVLSHGESAFLLLLAEGLLGSLILIRSHSNLPEPWSEHGEWHESSLHEGRQEDAQRWRTSLSATKSSVNGTPYTLSLLLAQNGQSTSNVLADNTDLSEFSRSSSSHLSNTKLRAQRGKEANYSSELLLVRLNGGQQIILILLTKFNGLHAGYTISTIISQLHTHFSGSMAISIIANQNIPPGFMGSIHSLLLDCTPSVQNSIQKQLLSIALPIIYSPGMEECTCLNLYSRVPDLSRNVKLFLLLP